MGWLDKAQAAAKIASLEAAKIAEELKKSLETTETDSEKTASNKELLQGIISLSKDAVAGAKQVTSELVADASQTEIGQLVGEGTRGISKAIQNLPGVGLLSDAIRARHGVPSLVTQLSADPVNALKNLQLAESMARVEKELKFTDTATGVFHPIMAIAREGVKQTAKIGEVEQDPLRHSLLKRAFYFATEDISNSNDIKHISNALHTLARIYLSTNDSEVSLLVIEVVEKINPDNVEVNFTKGLAHLQSGEIVLARSSADICISNGFTLGHQLLADICLLDETTSMKLRLQNYENLKSKVSQADRHSYYGFIADSSSVATQLLSDQIEKVNEIAKKVRNDS